MEPEDKVIRISDFAVCRKMLETVCGKAGCSFVDLELRFATEEPHIEDEGVLVIPETNKLSKTLFTIMRLYLDNMDRICGISLDPEIKADATNFMFNLSRGMTIWNKHIRQETPDGFVPQWLDQYPMVWTLIKGLVTPLLQSPIKNIKIVAGHSSQHDVAKYMKTQEPFVFVNLDVESIAIRSAYLFYEVLKAYTDNPDSVLRCIFADRYLKQKFLGFVSMALDHDEDAANFLGILSILCNSDSLKESAVNTFAGNGNNVKVALFQPSNWWFLGLFEKMLDGSRGSDWTVYRGWKPFTDELHSKIEKERRRRGLEEVPLELLLRIQGDEFTVDGDRTLQALLSNERIW